VKIIENVLFYSEIATKNLESFIFGFYQITITAKRYDGFVNSKFGKNPLERKNERKSKER
jgi:hypothetical protein